MVGGEGRTTVEGRVGRDFSLCWVWWGLRARQSSASSHYLDNFV